MHFSYRQTFRNDTVAALATPAGEGAIALIRISGREALAIAEKIFSKSVSHLASHTAHYGKILSAQRQPIDHVLLLIMKAPRSYTGEDTVEISCHGGSLIARKILERIYEAGARPAEPGEFSLRAFLNGKIDLAQAEAVQTLIAAKNETAMHQAEKQLEGALSKKISSFQKKLTDIAAILEASVDFPEEGLHFDTQENILFQIETICEEMEKLCNTFHEGRAVHEGLSLCLLGSPNVGKSSLMNTLLGKERAIVTEIAGTTRDLLEEDLRFIDLHFRLIDTAGIRETDEVIEKEGIRRSQKAMKDADLVLLLLDASRPLEANDRSLLESAPKEKTLIIWNKIDLGPIDPNVSTIGISAKEGIGLENLRQAIHQFFWKKGPPPKDEVLISTLRHHQALIRGIEHARAVIQGLKNSVSAEFPAADMRSCLNELGTIIGMNVTEEVLSAIFSKFCLGK